MLMLSQNRADATYGLRESCTIFTALDEFTIHKQVQRLATCLVCGILLNQEVKEHICRALSLMALADKKTSYVKRWSNPQ